MSADLWQYIAPATDAGNLSGRPVGVTQNPGGDAIHQAQFDAPNSRRVFHTKGTHGVPADFEELYVEGDYILRAIDTSRPAKDGGPYTLHDTLTGRGSRWAKRYMAVGEVFERNPYVSPFNMQTGQRGPAGGPVRTWLKLAAVHPKWRGVDDVVELWWLTNSPTQTSVEERYFYGKGLGLVGFEGPGLKTYPNHIWDKRPPAAGVPVLTRKALGFAIPALPAEMTTDFRITNPARYAHTVYSNFGWRDSPGKPGERDFHGGVDLTPSGPGPYPVHAAAAGRVVYAGSDTIGYGTRVDIDHGGGIVTRYAHMKPLLVSAGQQVTDATKIGEAEQQGWATGIHLHFEIRKDGVPMDPLPFLNAAAPPVQPPPATPPSPGGDTPPALLTILTTDEVRQLATHHEAIAAIYRAALARQST